MMKIKQVILSFTLIIVFIFIGCNENNDLPTIPEEPMIDLPSSGSIVIENGSEEIMDCTPELFIKSENADFMAFSGDGIHWSEWIDYQENYNLFNIANNKNGTEMSSGLKSVYIRFKDEKGNLSPENEIACDTVNYIIGELFTISVEPREIDLYVGESHQFTVHGFDQQLNEVPLEHEKAYWTKCCGVGKLNPSTGLFTIYTTPAVTGIRDITAHYQSLGAGAKINVLGKIDS